MSRIGSRRNPITIEARRPGCQSPKQADIARRVGRTRQLVSQWVGGSTGPGGFPTPVSPIGKAVPLWAWRDVAEWLERAGLIDQRVVDEAKAVETINAALAWERQRKTDPALADAVAASLAGAGGG